MISLLERTAQEQDPMLAPSMVCLITSWEAPCGIAEHSAQLKEAVEQADAGIRIYVPSEGSAPPTPDFVKQVWGRGWPILHLNYHAALHSLWTPEWIPIFQKLGARVVVTFHDTGVPNSPLAKALHDVCDAFIVHEPAEDLPRARYWRMGVADWGRVPPEINRWLEPRPILGSVGFPFPWKNYDKLAEITALNGWALTLLAPTATEEQVTLWISINPHTIVDTHFRPRRDVVATLASCDATAFLYVCHNTGQSAAILQGIAARKPVIALKGCRQFRALYDDPIGRTTIRWAETMEDVGAHLRHVRIQRVDPATVALAEQESWIKLGGKYAQLYRSLLV